MSPSWSIVWRSLTLSCALGVLGCSHFVHHDATPFTDLSPVDRTYVELTGFFQPEQLAERTGIYLVEPYRRGKIPVLLVHGFTSTPATWAPLFNDLQSDPELREHYQFWFYFYPTGNPYFVSAADLRARLTLLREQIDPAHSDIALDNMVVMGHSMGGLVAKLLATDGGDDLWHLVCAQPFDSLQMQPQTRSELQRLFFFDKQSCVRRVVFLGTPHHGARLSVSAPARLAAHFVHLPKTLTDAAQDLAQQNPRAEFRFTPEHLPTSLTSLTPGDQGLETLARRAKPDTVHFHSIVGIAPLTSAVAERILGAVPPPEKTDGVVAYASAHLDGVDSECVVPADHTHVHRHPQALQEVRRILREHLRTMPE
jgi:pimeloyl-ACP methyl ester carboxylesterase